MWHGLHWVLTGSAEPTADVTSSALLGGRPVVDPFYVAAAQSEEVVLQVIC